MQRALWGLCAAQRCAKAAKNICDYGQLARHINITEVNVMYNCTPGKKTNTQFQLKGPSSLADSAANAKIFKILIPKALPDPSIMFKPLTTCAKPTTKILKRNRMFPAAPAHESPQAASGKW